MALSPKDPAEKIIVTFEFSNVATAISNPVITLNIKGTATDVTSSMLSGTSQVTGTKVLQMLQGGESGKQYDVRCVVDSATGERFVAKDILVVKTV